MKDTQAKSKAEYKKKTKEGLENWKKSNYKFIIYL
jgi:hypothetical protein